MNNITRVISVLLLAVWSVGAQAGVISLPMVLDSVVPVPGFEWQGSPLTSFVTIREPTNGGGWNLEIENNLSNPTAQVTGLFFNLAETPTVETVDVEIFNPANFVSYTESLVPNLVLGGLNFNALLSFTASPILSGGKRLLELNGDLLPLVSVYGNTFSVVAEVNYAPSGVLPRSRTSYVGATAVPAPASLLLVALGLPLFLLTRGAGRKFC